MSSYSIGVQGIYTRFHSGSHTAIDWTDRSVCQTEHAYLRHEHCSSPAP